MSMNYDFDSNDQDDAIFNGVNVNHSIDEFNIVDCDINDLDALDFSNVTVLALPDEVSYD